MTVKSEENNQNEDQTQESNSTTPELTLEQALERISHLEGVNKEVIESRDKVKSKLKSYEDEKESQEQKTLEEQGMYKELLEKEKSRADTLEHALRTSAIDGVLDRKLADSGLSQDALNTAKALIDRSNIGFENNTVDDKTVADAIEQLKQNHSVLFSVKQKTPDVKRANVEPDQGSYEAELKKIRLNANSRTAKRDLEALRAKYGRN